MDERHVSGAAAHAVAEIRTMLVSAELLPGQPIRQEALAARLGLSRAPIREALGILKSEGVLDHERNVGYSVKRLTQSELEQAYLIRRALETEVVLALPQLPDEVLTELEELNAEIAVAAKADDIALVARLNHQFHFTIYAASGLELVVNEIQRMWAYTDAYRSFYLYDQDARERIVREHEGILEAFRARDAVLVAKRLDEHRSRVPEQLSFLLAKTPGFIDPRA